MEIAPLVMLLTAGWCLILHCSILKCFYGPRPQSFLVSHGYVFCFVNSVLSGIAITSGEGAGRLAGLLFAQYMSRLMTKPTK